MLACGALVAASAQTPLETAQQIARAEAAALEYLASHALEMGVERGDLSVVRSDIDGQSLIHVRVRQTFRGVPVFGGEAIVHLRGSGEVLGQTNSLVGKITLDTRPRITVEAALERARTEVGCADCVTQKPDLWVLRHEGVDHLTYRVQARLGGAGTSPALPIVFIDAHDGRLVLRYDNLQTGKRQQ